MTVLLHIDRARRLWGIDSINYNNTTAIEDFNIVYHRVERAIVKLQEDFFWQNFYLDDTVIGQSEYAIPTGATKILDIAVKYRADDDYIPARLTDIQNLDYDVEWYKKNQPTSQPFYHLSDNSYFVYPAFTSVLSDAVRVTAIQKLSDLTISNTSNEIFNGKITDDYHYILDLGLLEYIYAQRQMPNEAMKARNDFERELQILLDTLDERTPWYQESEMPNITHLG